MSFDGEDPAPVSETVSEHVDSETDLEIDAERAADAPPDADQDPGEPSGSLLIAEGDIAADYLERLLDIVDYDGDIDLDVENGRAIVAIIGTDLQALVGTRGETLDALQELTRLAVAQKTGNRSRLMLDISGHRQARRGELTTLATKTAAQVLESGESVRLSAMNPFERKVVHDAVATIGGVHSESEGEEPNRRVVVLLGD
jgi:spoIIIJ-associated protein